MQNQSDLVGDSLASVSLTIGDYQLISVPTGEFGLDGGAMFGTVPRVLWAKSNPPDEQNRIRMQARALLLKSKERVILVDTGNGVDFVRKYGEKLGAKFARLYNVKENGLSQALRSAGLTEDDITDVILTHLHFDHAGGATCWRDGKIVPTFPRATYYVQKANLETARNPNVRERASYLSANFEPLVAAGVLKLLEGPIASLFPNVSILISDGHTCAHQVVKIHDDQTTVFYCGDLIPTSSHVRAAWVMGYDLEPLKIIAEKHEVLKETAQTNGYLFFEHDPDCDLAQVAIENAEFKVISRFRLEAKS